MGRTVCALHEEHEDRTTTERFASEASLREDTEFTDPQSAPTCVAVKRLSAGALRRP